MKTKTAKVRLSKQQLREKLSEFEKRFGMPSAVFYAKYTRGEVGDQREFIRWAGLCNMAAAAGLLELVAA